MFRTDIPVPTAVPGKAELTLNATTSERFSPANDYVTVRVLLSLVLGLRPLPPHRSWLMLLHMQPFLTAPSVKQNGCCAAFLRVESLLPVLSKRRAFRIAGSRHCICPLSSIHEVMFHQHSSGSQSHVPSYFSTLCSRESCTATEAFGSMISLSIIVA